MTNKNLKESLDKVFYSQSEKLRMRGINRVRIRENVMNTVEKMAVQQRENEIVSFLQENRLKVPTKLKQDLKCSVMNEVYRREKEQMFSFESGLLFFLQKGIATSFALVLLISVILGPLQSINGIDFVQNARASYIVCNGSVEINGQICVGQMRKEVRHGDEIVTYKGSTATVYHQNFSRTYFSEETKASLTDISNKNDKLNILVADGRVWHYSPSDLSILKTDTVTAEIIGGAISLETTEGNRGKTELFATVPYEVQISDRKKSTTRLTLLNSEKVSIHNRSNHFMRSQMVQDDLSRDAFAALNVQDDEVFLADLRRSITERKTQFAGNLPGELRDSLSKMAYSAKIALTPNQEVRNNMQLSLLEELFSEAIVLAEKGDKAMALETFQSYRKNFASLVQSKFDKLSQDGSDKNARELALFEEHQEIVSLYDPSDSAFFLRESFVDVALELEPYMLGRSFREVGQQIATSELLRAHKTIEEGKEDFAAQHLKAYEHILDKALLTEDSHESPESVKTDDLVILKDIAKKSRRLRPKVEEIAQRKVSRIKDLASDKLPQSVTTSTVAGTAYKEPETDRSTTKIVGLAVKEDETIQSL